MCAAAAGQPAHPEGLPADRANRGSSRGPGRRIPASRVLPAAHDAAPEERTVQRAPLGCARQRGAAGARQPAEKRQRCRGSCQQASQPWWQPSCSCCGVFELSGKPSGAAAAAWRGGGWSQGGTHDPGRSAWREGMDGGGRSRGAEWRGALRKRTLRRHRWCRYPACSAAATARQRRRGVSCAHL